MREINKLDKQRGLSLTNTTSCYLDACEGRERDYLSSTHVEKLELDRDLVQERVTKKYNSISC